MSYQEAKDKYAAYGVDVEEAIETLKTVPVSLHCWQGDDVRGFDTDPSKPLTGGIQTTGNYPGRARTPEELMADLDKVLSLIPGRPTMNLPSSKTAVGQTATNWSRSILKNGFSSVKSAAWAVISIRRFSAIRTAIP